jgi:hypothetical protein
MCEVFMLIVFVYIQVLMLFARLSVWKAVPKAEKLEIP